MPLLAPSGGGLILYQAYGNLYAMTGSSTSALQVLRRLGSIFTSVYAADQKLKKAYKVYKAGKRLLYVKRNKAISLGKTTSRVGIEDVRYELNTSSLQERCRILKNLLDRVSQLR
ncbi:hypothetical protein Tco_0397741 [Tanacetum coccineum]